MDMVTEAQLQDDLTRAMKAREMQKVYVLRGLMAAVKNLKVEKQVKELASGDIAGLIRKEINKRAEAADFARRAGREELAARSEEEKVILEAYLPQQMTPAALEDAIRQIAVEIGTTQIGPVMARLRERYPGRYDGKLASELVRKLSS